MNDRPIWPATTPRFPAGGGDQVTAITILLRPQAPNDTTEVSDIAADNSGRPRPLPPAIGHVRCRTRSRPSRRDGPKRLLPAEAVSVVGCADGRDRCGPPLGRRVGTGVGGQGRRRDRRPSPTTFGGGRWCSGEPELGVAGVLAYLQRTFGEEDAIECRFGEPVATPVCPSDDVAAQGAFRCDRAALGCPLGAGSRRAYSSKEALALASSLRYRPVTQARGSPVDSRHVLVHPSRPWGGHRA